MKNDRSLFLRLVIFTTTTSADHCCCTMSLTMNHRHALSAPMPPQLLATSSGQTYDLMYYLKGAAAGGICCSITHGALTPVDVVKTRVQLDPVKVRSVCVSVCVCLHFSHFVQYNKGLIGGFRQIIAEEGAMALTTGLGATATGYFIQGWFKFGGVELIKINAAQALGEQAAWDNKTGIYVAAAAGAEFVADVFLCPLEAVRIRAVSDPTWANGLGDGFVKMAKSEGIGGFYAGFAPILLKQIPYTIAKFVVQGTVADNMYASLGKTPKELSSTTNVGVSLSSGVIAGVASAIISHPADTLLSKINKKGAGGEGSMLVRLARVAREIGFWKLCTVGLAPRCVMIGTLTAGQFGIFDTVMNALGATKFHFTNPATGGH
jgi:solute carrier family 25 (mitochondrial phosphate transporter), member 3